MASITRSALANSFGIRPKHVMTLSRHLNTTRSALAAKPAAPAAPVSEAEAADPAVEPKKGGEGFLGALFYGSKAAKEEGMVSGSAGQHSKLVGRGKYVHEKVTHNVKADKREEYLEAAEKYYTSLAKRGSELGGVKLTGSWETVVGSVGEFTHILEYEGYKGYDRSLEALRNDPETTAAYKKILPHLNSRQHQIIMEFSFWPSSPPHDSGYPNGGIFEMRTYQLQPGKLLEWEASWRRGLEARKKFVSPVGAFFSQAGQLHEVHHIWQYPDMATRKKTRDQAWSVGSWSDTVQETVKLAQTMKSAILVPCKWSPLR